MLSRLPIISSLAVLAAFSVNCSSGAGAPTTSSPSTTPLESTVDTGTAPCNLHTSFGDVDGDSQCILPPDPAGARSAAGGNEA